MRESLENMSAPRASSALFGTIIAPLIGEIDDNRWDEMKDAATLPCEVPDCGCEKLRVAVYETLDLLRTDYREQVKGI